MIQNNLISLYLHRFLPPPNTYTGLRLSTSELSGTSPHLFFFSFKIYQQMSLRLTSCAQRNSSDQIHSFCFPSSGCLYWEGTRSSRKEKDQSFLMRDSISLLIDCTLHNAFSLINFAKKKKKRIINTSISALCSGGLQQRLGTHCDP